MFEWWNSLSVATQIFYCVAIPSTLILLIQTILGFIGVDGDPDADTDLSAEDAVDLPDGVYDSDTDTDTEPADGMDSLKLFTFRGIIAFFVTFGWVGVAMDATGAPIWITVPVALVCGAVMMLSLALILRMVMGLRSDGNADNRNAVGQAGKVQLTIPAARSGEGKVHLMLQGSYVERNAVTDDAEAIPTGCEVVVVGVSGATDLVVTRK